MDSMTGTDSGGPGLDPDPPGSIGTTHRRSSSSAEPVWWAPPAPTRIRGIGDLVTLFVERRPGRHRAPVTAPRAVRGLDQLLAPLMRGGW